MKVVEIVGYKRTDLGKTATKQLREEALVPAVLYGGEEVMHFAAPIYLFKDVVYTNEPCFVELNIEGTIRKGIMKAVQFHPVSDALTHVDFLELVDAKPVVMEIPVAFEGTSPGVLQGGKLTPKLRKLKVKALPEHMPSFVKVSIDGLELGKSVKVGDVKTDNYEVLYNPSVTIASVVVTRALRQAAQQGK